MLELESGLGLGGGLGLGLESGLGLGGGLRFKLGGGLCFEGAIIGYVDRVC